MTDRELQDELIRYLSDGHARARMPSALKLGPEQAARAAQFARFLARRYYRDRLGRSFRYSAWLESARRAIDVVEGQDFDAIVREGILGSLAAAQGVGELAINWLRDCRPPQESWWPTLLDYECSHFLQTATSELATPGRAPRPGASARCHAFAWKMPEMLARLKRRQAITENLRGQVTLLFSRTRAGRIYVMEVDALTAAIFTAADGLRDQAHIAAAANVSAETARPILNSLFEIGALVPAGDAMSRTEDFQPASVLGI